MESKQNNKNGKQVYTLSVSEKFKKDLPDGEYEVAFRRWLVRELNDKNMTRQEAIVAFNFDPQTTHSRFTKWVTRYSDEHEVTLPDMSSKEKAEKQALEKRIKELEKKLDSSVMHVKALNTFIDIAEEQLKISIRKKSGTKQ